MAPPSPPDAIDPLDPQAWFRLLVDAVAGLQRRDISPAQTYLRFVERHRGRAAAEAARTNVRELAAAPSWASAAMWPGWGYQPKPPKRVEGHRGRR